MKINQFSDLTVWQEGHKLALAIYGATAQFPPGERFGIVQQMRRSASSVCANIAEGFGRRTTRELLRSLQISRGELEETRYFLILARDLGYLKRGDFEVMQVKCDVVGKLINALSSSLGSRLSATGLAKPPYEVRPH